MDKAVLNISTKEFTTELSYVTVSRVKKFDKLSDKSDISINVNAHYYIPIFAVTWEFLNDRDICDRTQFPLTLSYVIIVYKFQEIIVNKAVLNISTKEFTTKLSYVAVSRVKKFDRLLFKELFNYERFKEKPNNNQ